MSNKPLVSVIVPVYNVEEYIKECLDSIVGQSYSSIEIILINDGSTDKSLEILTSYASDDRVKIVTQENKGLSCSRNKGISIATGKYLLFVDGDDFIEKQMIKNLVEQLETFHCDLIRFNGISFYDNVPKDSELKENSYDFSHRLKPGRVYGESSYDFNRKTFASSVALYMVKRELIINNHIRFKKDIIHEDELFTTQIFVAAHSMCYDNHSYYHRRYRRGSIMTNKTFEQEKNSFDSYFVVFKELEKMHHLDIYNRKQKKLIKRQLLSIYSGMTKKKLPENYKQKYLKQSSTISLKNELYLKVLSIVRNKQ